MGSTLIAAFGNQYRRDDGVGYVVVNVIRERLGRPALTPLDDGYDDLGHAVDTIVLHQLVPELAETVADYDLLIFIDAHVGSIPEIIREEHLERKYRTPFVSHQFHPSTVLALTHQMYGRAPDTVLLSIRGYDFDFGEGLSPETTMLVEPAVTRVLALIDGKRAHA